MPCLKRVNEVLPYVYSSVFAMVFCVSLLSCAAKKKMTKGVVSQSSWVKEQLKEWELFVHSQFLVNMDKIKVRVRVRVRVRIECGLGLPLNVKEWKTLNFETFVLWNKKTEYEKWNYKTMHG